MDTEKRGSTGAVRQREVPESLLERAKERFWKKVDKNGPIPEHRPELGPCWVWMGILNNWHYGHFRFNGKRYLTHKFAWKIKRGEVPLGKELDHLCNLPKCVNPNHLEAVTHQENMRRGLNSPTGTNFRKTHCIYRHEFNQENTEIRYNGFRRCKICHRRQYLARYYRFRV